MMLQFFMILDLVVDIILGNKKRAVYNALYPTLLKINKTMERRERDSNPRCLSARRFSRPL